jgi:hypothetical protein
MKRSASVFCVSSVHVFCRLVVANFFITTLHVDKNAHKSYFSSDNLKQFLLKKSNILVYIYPIAQNVATLTKIRMTGKLTCPQ